MTKNSEKRVPALRFKGFTNDWEQRKLGEVTQRVQGNDNNMNRPVLTISAKTGWMTQSNRFSSIIAGSEKKKYTLLKKGELSYNHGNSKIAPFGTVFMLNNYSEALVPKVYHSFKANYYMNPYFLELYFHTKKLDPQLRKFISSSARMDGLLNITYKWFEKIFIFSPQLSEQNKLEKIFLLINKYISLQQRKNILLYKLRKSLLSTLLTDKCTPKVRFKSFLEPLKKQKLGDMAPLRGGFAFKANNYVNTGIPIIRISNILSNGSIGGNFAYYSEQSDDSNYILFNGSALIAMSGATTGKTAILDLEKKKKVYQNQRVGYFTPTKNSDYSFIKAIIKSNYFLKQLNSIMVAGAQPNVSAVDIDNFTFYFPESKKEQKYIGNNFEIINKIILLQKNRVDKLKKLKRSLLQQLFI